MNTLTETIKLYHFTHFGALRRIAAESFIKPGRTLMSSGKFEIAAISLTSDADPLGHGLPDGRALEAGDGEGLETTVIVKGQRYCVDATECRFLIELPIDDPKLVALSTYFEGTKSQLDLFRRLERSAYFPTHKATASEEAHAAAMFETSQWKPKGASWYYYFGSIPVANCAAAFRTSNGRYFAFPSREAS